MGRRSTTLVASCWTIFVAGLALAQGQGQNQPPRPVRSPSQEMLASWNGVHHKLAVMAEDFPEDKYDFKVQKDERSFAENLLHVAGTDYLFLSAISGHKMGPAGGENPSRNDFKTKADVVKLMHQVMDDGAALIQTQGDAGLERVIKSPFGNYMVHADAVWCEAIEHAGEHYGQLVVYYRANNLVPPESRPQSH
jgi:uncharacterized damage-inducible protein DinB